MQTIDLRKALNCIKEQKKNGTYHGARIGIVDFNKYKELCYYREPILFTPSTYGKNTSTIEMPFDKKAIKKRKLNGSSITTCLSMTFVPDECITEILI